MIKDVLDTYFTTISKSEIRMLKQTFSFINNKKCKYQTKFLKRTLKYLSYIFLLDIFVPSMELNVQGAVNSDIGTEFYQLKLSNYCEVKYMSACVEYGNKQSYLMNNELSFEKEMLSEIVVQNNEFYSIEQNEFFAPTTSKNINKHDIVYSYQDQIIDNKGNLNYTYFNGNKKIVRDYLILFSILIIVVLFTLNVRKFMSEIGKYWGRKKIIKQLKNNQFIVYYQPVIDPYQHKLMACEALLRFNDGNKILTPFHFLHRIEKIEMMGEMTLWLLKQVIKDYQVIKMSNKLMLDDEFYISLNVSFKELENSFFIERVKNIISTINLTQIKVCFEIIERYPLYNQKKVNQAIKELRELGIRIAIDDFGVEHSNLDILDKIEYDIIKLDKYFSDGIENSFVRRQTVFFIEDFIRQQQKKLIIEGVESQSQLEIIKELSSGVVFIQGYLYSPPISLDEIINFKID